MGIIADTHDNRRAIEKAVALFNRRGVGMVFHAGDVVSPLTVLDFSKLACGKVAVFGNNDGERMEQILAERNRSLFHPARWPSIALAAYGACLIGLMLVHHLVMTGLALLGLVLLRLPWALWESLTMEQDPAGAESVPTPWLNPLRTWLPHFRRKDPDARIGPVLAEQDGPGIHVVVAEMARKVGSAEPDEIRLTSLPCCGVLEQPDWGGLRPRSRILVLGLPLIYVLSVEELRAVVAHELAHLSRGDAALAFVISQFLDSLDQAIDTVGAGFTAARQRTDREVPLETSQS